MIPIWLSTPGVATQFQRQVLPFESLSDPPQGPRWHGSADRDRIGGVCDHVEVDSTRGAGAFTTKAHVEVRQASREPSSTDGRAVACAGRVRLAVVSDRSRSAASRAPVLPVRTVITNDWFGYISLAKRGYKHLAVAEEYADHSSRLLQPGRAAFISSSQPEDVVERHSRLEPPAPPSLPQRVHIPLRQAISSRSTPSGPCSGSMSPLPLTPSFARAIGSINVVVVGDNRIGMV